MLAYELVAGCPPFYCEDRMAMYEAIVHVKYGIPRHFSPVRQIFQSVNLGMYIKHTFWSIELPRRCHTSLKGTKRE